MSVSTTRKDHPLSMRLPAGDLAVIDRAADLRGRSRTDFVREAAVRAAEEVLVERHHNPDEPGGRSKPSPRLSPSLGHRCRRWTSCSGEGRPGSSRSGLPLSAPERLEVSHDLGPFACGKPALDHWLKTRATANQTRGFTVVMVMHEAGRVAAYYGLAPTAIMPNALPRSIRTGQPPNPVPCLLLGQLATDTQWAGRGHRHRAAPPRVGTQSRRGSADRRPRALVVVHAIDEDAARFWQRRGFVPSKDDGFTLFRAIPDIAASLRAAGLTPDDV